jgi:nitrite reductase (NAD(P)H)
MVPRHAQLFASDVPPTKVVRIIDRYLMLYIRTADRLVRTAPWVASFEGGIEKLKKIILEDELGICADLEAEMHSLVGTYEDEWKKAVNDPDLRKQFRQFVNTVSVPF